MKRKTYRDISKDFLNPENVLSTKNVRENILMGLKDQPRYQLVLEQNSDHKKIDLNYILGKNCNINPDIVNKLQQQ